MALIYNRAGMSSTTGGTGSLTLTAALAAGTAINSCSFDTFANAGVANNEVVAYLILDSNGAWEYGTGIYTTAGPALSTRTVERSSAGAGTAITCSASVQVFVTARKKDLHYVPQALTDLATTAWDMKDGQIATWTLGGNRTLSAPTNRRPGEVYLIVTQDATGTRTVTWNSVFKWPDAEGGSSGPPPRLKTGAGAVDVFRFVDDGTNLYGTHVNGMFTTFGDVNIMSGTLNLTASHDGSVIINAGANRTVNLPPVSKGTRHAFFTSGGTLLVDTPGAETINTATGAVANVTLRDGAFMILVSDGTNWYALADSNFNRRGYQTLTDAATIAWDTNLGRSAQVTIGAVGRTMGAPSNLIAGESYTLIVIQDATGSRTITTWNAVFKWAGGVTPVLTTTANAKDIISGVSDGTNIYCTWINDVK